MGEGKTEEEKTSEQFALLVYDSVLINFPFLDSIEKRTDSFTNIIQEQVTN